MPRCTYFIAIVTMALLLLSGAGIPVEARQNGPSAESREDWPAPLRQLVNEAEQLAADGDFQKAARLLSRHLEQKPGPFCAYIYYDLGSFLHQAGNNDAAVKPLQTAVEKRPNFPEAWQTLGAVQHANKRLAEAAAALERAVTLNDSAETRYQCALCWLAAQKPQKALPLLRQLEKTPQPRPEWLVALSEALKGLKKNEETARAMERAARLNNDPDLFYQAAWRWLEANRPGKALPLLETLAREKKPRLPWLLALCHVHIILNQPARAAAVMETVIRRDARPEYLYNGGLLWLQADQAGKALPHLRRLADLPAPKAEWLIALGQAWLNTGDVPKAAEATERAARISGKPGHAYRAGVLRLQLEQADAALVWLQPLQQHRHPKADWLIALARARILKKDYPAAAIAMEQAAAISGNQDHYFQAAQLWLQADRPRKALPLLKQLAATPKPKGDWLIALAGTWQRLDNLAAAAETMERAAGITGKGEHYHQAAMLWRQQKKLARTLAMLNICAGKKPLRQRWLVDLADVLLELGKNREARAAMARTALSDKKIPADVRFRGATLWLHLQRPRQALPILSALCRTKKPSYGWLAALVKTCVELDKRSQAEKALGRLLDLHGENPDAWQLAAWVALQQSDYAAAAAATEVLARLKPDNGDHVRNLSRYYAMAGIPVRAAEAVRKTLPKKPAAKDWDRLTNIYLSGQRFAMALIPARTAVAAGQTAERWETVGDILYRLRRFEESCDAYRHAAALSDNAGLLLKSGYALLKAKDLDEAAGCFRSAIKRAGDNAAMAKTARQNLAYIASLQEMRQAQAD
jgi:tetratricopeptide (TPR) repeat protein